MDGSFVRTEGAMVAVFAPHLIVPTSDREKFCSTGKRDGRNGICGRVSHFYILFGRCRRRPASRRARAKERHCESLKRGLGRSLSNDGDCTVAVQRPSFSRVFSAVL